MKRMILAVLPALAAATILAQAPTEPGIENRDSQMNLKIYTEDFAPFNYQAEDGQITGQATEVVREILKRMGSTADIRLLPWAEGYQQVQTQTDAVLYSMARTADREALFQWVGPVGSYEHMIYALEDSSIEIQSLEQLKTVPAIGVVQDDARHQFLQQNQITNVALYANDAECYSALRKGDVALVVGSCETMPSMVRQARMEPADLKPVYSLRKYPLYVAFHKDAPAELIAQWQAALDQMNLDGTFAAILARWSAAPQASAPVKSGISGSEAVAPLLSACIDARLGGFLEVLQALSLTQEARAGEWPRLKALLASREAAAPAGRMWYALPDGSYSTTVDDLTSKNIKDRAYFPVVMSGKPVLGTIVSSKSTGRPVVVAAAPILQSGEVTGALGTSIYLQDINNEMVQALPLPANQMFLAVHPDGTMALHSTDTWIGQPVSDFEPQGVLGAALKEESGKCRFGLSGKIWEAVWVTAPRTGWRVVIACEK